MFASCRNRGCLYRVLQPAAKISNRTRALYQGERAFLKRTEKGDEEGKKEADRYTHFLQEYFEYPLPFYARLTQHT